MEAGELSSEPSESMRTREGYIRSALLVKCPVPFLHTWHNKLVVWSCEDVPHDGFDAGKHVSELDGIVNIGNDAYFCVSVGESDACFVTAVENGLEGLLIVDGLVFIIAEQFCSDTDLAHVWVAASPGYREGRSEYSSDFSKKGPFGDADLGGGRSG